jgi:predicted ATP-grasp superfamily ATP-dependent carboligase
MANVVLFGPWGPESLAFARSLRRRGIGTYLVHATDQPPPQWSLSSLRGYSTMPARLEQTPEGIAWLADYVRGVDASALVATVDGDLIWLARHRHEFGPSCRVLVQPAESLDALLSKRHQASLARDAGLTVLPTHVLMHQDDADSIPASDYPLALRPDRPFGVPVDPDV